MPIFDLDIPDSLTGPQLDLYLSRGWYRMRQTLFTTSGIWNEEETEFRPVYWLRFPVDEIREHRSHRAIRKKNSRFRVEYAEEFRADYHDHLLYFMYVIKSPFDSYQSIDDALYNACEKDIFHTKAIRIWDVNRLIAAGIFDAGQTALASILHFYDPAYASHSLGKYLMLLTIDYMKRRGYTFYYPGYVVRGNPRFDYKLFLGKEAAYFFNTESQAWDPFRDELLISEQTLHLVHDAGN